jgi:hypothetical protein
MRPGCSPFFQTKSIFNGISSDLAYQSYSWHSPSGTEKVFPALPGFIPAIVHPAAAFPGGRDLSF